MWNIGVLALLPGQVAVPLSEGQYLRSCMAHIPADNIKTLLSRQGQCLIKARIGRALLQKPSSLQGRICMFPSSAVWLVCPFFPRPRGHAFGNINTFLADHFYHIFLRKRIDSFRPHQSFTSSFPTLEGAPSSPIAFSNLCGFHVSLCRDV